MPPKMGRYQASTAFFRINSLQGNQKRDVFIHVPSLFFLSLVLRTNLLLMGPTDIGAILISEGLANPYDGGQRGD